MGARFKPLPRKTVERARRLYESGASVASIVAELNFSASTLYRYVDLDGWSRAGASARKAIKSARQVVAAKTSASRAKLRKATALAPATRATPDENTSPPSEPRSPTRRHDALIDRLYNVAEQQVAEIERRVGQAPESLAARERDARHFSSLVRMMRELAALGLAIASPGGEASPEDVTDHDDFERESADYRAQLERVLDALHERGRQQENGSANDAGDGGAEAAGGLELSRP